MIAGNAHHRERVVIVRLVELRIILRHLAVEIDDVAEMIEERGRPSLELRDQERTRT
jgi:hypothetical protein